MSSTTVQSAPAKTAQLTRALVLVVLVAAVAALYFFDLGQYLTLSYLKSQQADWLEFTNNNMSLAISVYMLVYIIVTALSFPGAAVMTLLGGAIFGVWLGTLLVSFASTIGATLAFLAARFLLRDSVQRKFGEKLSALNEGVAREGAFYLFTLRLAPAVPFFVVNLVMALTPMRVLPFFLVSQIGMLPGTLAFVNAGTQLAQIDSLKGILSPALIASFTVLGLLPLILKKVLQLFKTSWALRKFHKPQTYQYNQIVIGGGSAGLVTSYIAAAAQSRVALIEEHKMGGDCLNTGCVPSKALIRTGKFLSDVRKSKSLGIHTANVDFDFAEVMERVQRVIKKIEPHDSMERYRSLGVDCISGRAKVISPFEVEVDGKRLTTKNIVIATGARPLVPPIPGLDQMSALTSDNVWNLRKKPGRLLVLGGGPIGCELAQVFQRLGSKVTQVEKQDRLMAREDEDVSALILERFSQEGVDVRLGHTVKRFVIENGEKICIAERNNQEVRIAFDQVLLALGRVANTKGFGVQELGVELNRDGTIKVDENLASSVPNIYACGDVAGPYQFTHTAAHQAWFAAVNSMARPLYSFKVDYRVIPWCTYTDPEVARVGLSEADAKAKNIAYELTQYQMAGQDRALTEESAVGFVKVLTVPGRDRILGATIVGLHAGELMAEFVTAMKYNLGLNKILGTIHIYPTLTEANKAAAGVWRKKQTSTRTLRWAARYHQWRRS